MYKKYVTVNYIYPSYYIFNGDATEEEIIKFACEQDGFEPEDIHSIEYEHVEV